MTRDDPLFKRQQITRESQVHQRLSDGLSQVGIDYENEFCLHNKFFDIRIKQVRLLIEVDGEYWHNDSEAKINDAIKDKIAADEGYYTLRVSDSLIDSQLEVVLAQISRLIQWLKSQQSTKI